MILYNDDKVKIVATKCKAPTFRNVNGRTWDSGFIYIDGSKVEVWLDTTRGFYLYFQVGSDWYKMLMYPCLPGLGIITGLSYDIDPWNDERFTTTKN